MATKEYRELFQANTTEHAPARNFDRDSPLTQGIFTCFVDGSWKTNDRTSVVGWVLQLQDGTIDLLSLASRETSEAFPQLFTELHDLMWVSNACSGNNAFVLFCNTLKN